MIDLIVDTGADRAQSRAAGPIREVQLRDVRRAVQEADPLAVTVASDCMIAARNVRGAGGLARSCLTPEILSI